MYRFVCSAPNPGVKGYLRGLFYPNDEAGHALAEAWAQRENGSGRGIYDCLGLFRDGETVRRIVTTVALDRIVVDLDLRNIVQPREDVLACLHSLVLPPSLIKDSGYGLHAEWHLKELADDEAAMALAERIMKRLATILASDPMPTHRAAVLRRPGTDNTKIDGDWRKCRIIEASGAGYDITELAEMADTYGSRPRLTKIERPRANGYDARGITGSEPVDAAARLAAMQYLGPGDSAIHPTLLHVSASRTRSGVPVADTVTELLDAVRRCVADDPRAEAWDWDEEGHDIEGLCYSFVNKNPELACTLPDDLFVAWQAQLDAGGTPQIARTGRTGWRVCNRPVAASPPPSAGSAGSENGSRPGGTDPHWPTPYSKRDPGRIPQRKFILGLHYLLGVVTLTAAAGGVGKSVLTLLDAVSFATGYDLLLGVPLERRYGVWIWNAEDDVDEMERRVAGICAHYDIDRTDLDGWLYLDSGYDLPLDLAQGNSKTTVVQDGLITMIADRVKELGIEVVGLDPLVALHTMPEGDNPSLAKLLRTLNNKLAKPCGCAVDINHHTRKAAAGQDVMTVDDIRGAGTIVYSVRSGRMLHQMGLADAEKYGIEADDRFSYFRLERAKANMAKRGTICWVRLVEMPIANGPDGASGDVVTVPTLWAPPDAMEGVSDTVATAIRVEIAKGRYRRDVRAGASWAGKLVGRQLNFDTETKAGRLRARTVLEGLIKKGALATNIEYDKNRNAKEFVVPGLEVGKGGRSSKRSRSS